MVANRSTGRNPWRGLPFTLTAPAFYTSELADGAVTCPVRWLGTADALPATVIVTPHPLTTGRHPCCERHPDRPWISRRLDFIGFGSVHLSGTAKGAADGSTLRVVPTVGRRLMDAIQSDAAPALTPAGAADVQERIDWHMNRARMVLAAMAAQLYASRPRLLDGPCPLLSGFCDQWTSRGGVVTGHPATGLRLTEPGTY